MQKRLICLVLTAALLFGILPTFAYAAEPGDAPVPRLNETPADSVTVTVTLSNDGVPLMGADGTELVNLQVTVPYYDLAYYDLENYYRYGTEDGWGVYVSDEVIERPTLLHLYLYLLERYYIGLDEEDCCQGNQNPLYYSELTELLYFNGDAAYSSDTKGALTISGGPTSLYMTNFWGHDENLMYFVNHQYPLMSPGWGSTCDYILLEDGDVIDVAMFTDWGFYHVGGFNYFTDDVYQITAGETVTTQTLKAATIAGLDGNSPEVEVIENLNVFVYDSLWQPISEVGGSEGTYSVTFSEPGTYYLLGLDPNAATNKACYAPAVARVEVVPGDAAPEQEVMRLIDAIGTVTAESGEAIAAARSAYDALNDAQKALVTNYDVLLAAEEAYEEITNCPSAGMSDVPPSAWYHKGVDFALRNGLMSGVGDGLFNPGGKLTRAQLVTVLYAMAGRPETAGSNIFTDVKPGAYYEKAVVWAYENGLTSGTGDGKFGTNSNITRQDLVLMLRAYADMTGIDTTSSSTTDYADWGSVSGYAADAMAWAVENGLISGIGSGDSVLLKPKDPTSRGQIAVILMHFVRDIAG